jgi:hypothetical protein
VLLAGCSGLPTADPATPVTPAAVPEEPTTRAGPTVLAPGLTDAGVTDPGRLAEAHAAVLADRSFTARQATVQRYLNGTVQSRSERVVRMGPDRRQFYSLSIRQSRENDDWRLEQWANGSHVLQVSTTDDRTEYAVLRGPEGQPRSPRSLFPDNATNSGGIGRLLALVDPTVAASRTVDGLQRHTLSVRADEDSPPWLEDLRMTAIVDERGLVLAYSVSYTVTRDDEELRVTVEFTITEVDSTIVSRPSWAGRV